MPRKKLYGNDETVAFTIRLPRSLKEKIQQQARLHRRSLNQEIVWLLQQALEHLSSMPESEGERSSR